MFYAAIFRPLTFARNRATMASRKRKTRGQRETENETAGGGGTGRFCKRVSAKRPVRRLVAANFAFSEAAHLHHPAVFAVAAPLPKKFCDTFWEPCLVC